MLDRLRTATAAAVLTATALVVLGAPATASAPPGEQDSGTSQAPADGGEDVSAEQQDLVSFGISPAGPERPDDRPFLSFNAAAGSVLHDHVAVLNQDDAAIGLQVYVGDVVMAEGGGLSLRARAEPSTGAGSWISVTGPTDIEVPAQTTEAGLGFVIVPFTVTIPTNAEPGDHVAGVVASLTSLGTGGDGAPAIELEQRVAARIHIRVDGALEPGLEVTDVVATWLPGNLAGAAAGAVTVDYTLRNTGNVRMAVEPDVDVAGPFGLLPRSAAADRVDELMPGGEVRLTTVVDGVWPLGLETVTVNATAVAPGGGQDPGIGTVSTSIQVLALPWLYLALLLLLVAVLLTLALLRRRARARSGGRPTGPAPLGVQVHAPPAAEVQPAGELVPAGRHRR